MKETLNWKAKFNSKKTSKGTENRMLTKLGVLELIIVAVFLLALLSPYNTKLVNMLLYHPTRDIFIWNEKIQDFEQKYEMELLQTKFPSKNGKVIHAWYLKVPDSKFTYLVSHGNGGNLSNRYQLFSALMKSGGSVFIYDYQGYGQSEGEPDDQNIVDDGIAAYDYMVSKLQIPENKIIGYGESLGCAVATKIMEARPLKAVILQSPFSTLVEAAKDKMLWTKVYPDFMFSQRHLDNISAFKKKHPPLLLIHGQDDWILNAKYSQEIFDQACEPKELLMIPGRGHNNIYSFDENEDVIEKIIKFQNQII